MVQEDSTQIPSQRNQILYIRLDDMIFRSDAQLSKHYPFGRLELSIRTFLYVEKLRNVPSCIRPDDVYSRPDALIHKSSRAFKVQPTEQQSSWSGCSSFIYGNCVHQINRPDDSCYGPDMPSLDMEISCS
jgi:hypothetical protein